MLNLILLPTYIQKWTRQKHIKLINEKNPLYIVLQFLEIWHSTSIQLPIIYYLPIMIFNINIKYIWYLNRYKPNLSDKTKRPTMAKLCNPIIQISSELLFYVRRCWWLLLLSIGLYPKNPTVSDRNPRSLREYQSSWCWCGS